MNKLFLFLLLISINCYALEWECVKSKKSDWDCEFYRMNVPHGWIVYPGGYHSGMFFYPDQHHEWKIE
jgi:hypothetical protein